MKARRHLHQAGWTLPIIAFLVLSQSAARGADPTVEVVNQDNGPAAADTVRDWLPSFPHVQIFTQFHTGYDDNVRTTESGGGALFTSGNVNLSYHLPSRTTQLGLVADVGVTDYIDQRTDINASVDLSLSRNLTRRLSVNASIDASYRSEPDFNQNIGPNRFSGNFFSTSDNLSASYALSRRLSLVSSFNLLLVRYEDEATAFFTDREEYTFGEQLRFTLTRTTVLTGEYRFLLVDYVTYPLDSNTHFALAGVEHTFSRRLSAQFRAGASLRSLDQGGNQTNPDFEGSLNYTVSRHTTLSGTGSYSVEQPTQANVVGRTTFRTGLQLTHSFTGRISSSLGFAYHHDNDEQGTSFANTGPSFNEDTFDISLSVRYQFSPRLAFDLAINHSEIMSGQSLRDYSRNRYSIGLSYRF